MSDNIRTLITSAESEILEFKRDIPPSGIIAQNVAALANTRGGKIVFGVEEGGRVVGVSNPERAKARIREAINRISPEVTVTSETANIDGKEILVIGIEPNQSTLYLADSIAYQRIADRNLPISSQVILEKVAQRGDDNASVRNELQRLSHAVEKMNLELISERSWRSKMIEWLIGGAIGAVIGLILGLLFTI